MGKNQKQMSRQGRGVQISELIARRIGQLISEWHEPTVEYCKQLKPEKVEELESLIRSAENIFDILSKREIILMWNKFTDHYSVMIKDK